MLARWVAITGAPVLKKFDKDLVHSRRLGNIQVLQNLVNCCYFY